MLAIFELKALNTSYFFIYCEFANSHKCTESLYVEHVVKFAYRLAKA